MLAAILHNMCDVRYCFVVYLYFFQDEVKGSDMAAILDSSATKTYNGGFVVVKPTLQALRVYKKMRYVSGKFGYLREQQRLNLVLKELGKDKDSFNVTFLNRNNYVNGAQYFEHMIQLLPQKGDTCSSNGKKNCSVIVVHNNWIVSKAAKIYRFREHLMWLYDGEDQYYSSQTRRYITYTNPKPGALRLFIAKEIVQTKRQMSALRTALVIGFLLKRAVILPRFYCGLQARQCPLNSLIHIKTFDALFSNKYRENSFLQHPQVPGVVKQSTRYQKLVSNRARELAGGKIVDINSDDVVRLFGSFEESLIDVGNLDKINIIFSNHSLGEIFNDTVRKAFRQSDYRQQRLGEFV